MKAAGGLADVYREHLRGEAGKVRMVGLPCCEAGLRCFVFKYRFYLVNLIVLVSEISELAEDDQVEEDRQSGA